MIITLAFGLWSLFFLWNYSLIFGRTRDEVIPHLPPQLLYLLGCPFCCGFWLSIVSVFFGQPWFTPFVIGPLVLFIDLIYTTLSRTQDE